MKFIGIELRRACDTQQTGGVATKTSARAIPFPRLGLIACTCTGPMPHSYSTQLYTREPREGRVGENKGALSASSRWNAGGARLRAACHPHCSVSSPPARPPACRVTRTPMEKSMSMSARCCGPQYPLSPRLLLRDAPSGTGPVLAWVRAEPRRPAQPPDGHGVREAGREWSSRVRAKDHKSYQLQTCLRNGPRRSLQGGLELDGTL